MDNKNTFDESCSLIRTEIKAIGTKVYAFRLNTPAGKVSDDKMVSDTGEMMANVMLAYRHLEDAAMRLGKAIQAYEGGISIYDQNDARRVTSASLDASQK